MNAIAQLKTASLGDAMIRRFPPLYRRYRAELRAFDAADADARRAMQQVLIEDVLASATSLPGYSNHAGKPLAVYPELTKARLRTDQEAFQTVSGLLATKAATSGSSGVPLAIKRSFASVVFEQAAIDHVVALAGRDFRRDRVAILRGEAIKSPSDANPPYWRFERGGRIMNFSVAHLKRETARAFITALETFSPAILWAYPSALEMLAACLDLTGRRLAVPVVLTSSEVLTGEVRARAETLFGARVVDYYGQAERVCFAYALEAGAYHFMPAYGHVELPATDDRAPGRHRIIATNLRNSAQPLIRYRTDDIAVLPDNADAAHLEEVALGLRSFARIEGRESDYLAAPDGSRLIGMNHVPRGIEGLLQMQLRQTDADRVLVLAVPGEVPVDALRAEIEARVAARLPDTMHVEVRFCEAIAREKSGKMPLVVREHGISAPG